MKLSKMRWAVALFSLLLSYELQAATFSPTNATDLQTALTTAASNGEDDTINLSGTYTVTSVLTYSSTENFALTLAGAAAESTIMDGGGSTTILLIASSGTGLITISGITFQNGSATDYGAFYISTSGGADLQDNVFADNHATAGSYGAGLILALAGNVIFSNNTAHDNTATFVGGVGQISTISGTVTMESNTLSQNEAGDDYGTFLVTGVGGVTFNNNTITSNTAASDAGGIYLISSSGDVTASGNTISDNTATVDSYGGIFINGTAITFTNNTLSGNESAGVGGAALFGTGELIISNNTFTNNTVNAGGSEDGGGLYASTAGDVTLEGNTFSANNALNNFGGAYVASTAGSLTASGNTFSGNEASNDYASFYIAANTGLTFNQNIVLNNISGANQSGGLLINSTSGDVQVINNLFAGNEAPSNWAGLYLEDNATGSATTLSIINNTFTNNTTSLGSYAGLYADATDTSITINAYNNIFYGNTNSGSTGVGRDAYFANATSMLDVFNNDIGDLCFTAPASCDVADLGANAGNNLSNIDPLFIDVAADNYRLQASSTLIDMGLLTAPGLPSEDVLGNPRSFLTIPDIGAYEAVPEVSASSTTLDFGSIDINVSDSQTITLSNNGTYDLTVSALVLSDTTNYSLNTAEGSNPCGDANFVIESGGSCTLGVVFGPESTGTLAASFTITSDAPGSSSYVINLTGIGVEVTSGGAGCAMGGGSAMSVYSYILFALFFMTLRVRKR